MFLIENDISCNNLHYKIQMFYLELAYKLRDSSLCLTDSAKSALGEQYWQHIAQVIKRKSMSANRLDILNIIWRNKELDSFSLDESEWQTLIDYFNLTNGDKDNNLLWILIPVKPKILNIAGGSEELSHDEVLVYDILRKGILHLIQLRIVSELEFVYIQDISLLIFSFL
jgi:hypothetical protein